MSLLVQATAMAFSFDLSVPGSAKGTADNVTPLHVQMTIHLEVIAVSITAVKLQTKKAVW